MSILTPSMLNRQMIVLAANMPRLYDDGLFALSFETIIPSFALALELDDVIRDHLAPPLLAAWFGDRKAPPDRCYELPISLDVTACLDRYAGFICRLVNSYRIGDCGGSVTRFDICTDPGGDLI